MKGWLAPGTTFDLALEVTLTSKLATDLEGAYSVRGVVVQAPPVCLELYDPGGLSMAAALVVRVDCHPGLVLGVGCQACDSD